MYLWEKFKLKKKPTTKDGNLAPTGRKKQISLEVVGLDNASLRLAAVLLSTVFIMVALSYLAVPFYQIFCQTTGFGGTIQKPSKLPWAYEIP